MTIPLIVPDATSVMDGGTFRQYRQRLAETLGAFTSGTTRTTPTSLEATRRIISDQLKGGMASPARFDANFAYIVDGDQAGEVRRLVNGSLQGASGSALVDNGYSAPLVRGTGFELSALPAKRYFGVQGLLECINEGLELLPVIHVVSITAVDQQMVYPFFDYPWPIRGVRRVFYARTSVTNEQRREVSRGAWEFDLNADTPTLSFRYLPVNAGETIEVELLRPANTWIRHGGIWGDVTTPVDATSVGLQDEGDAALYDVVSVVAQARPIALQRLSLLYPVGSKERGLYMSESEHDVQKAALARWFGGFRGSGVQRVGAGVGRARSIGRWWW